MFDMDVRDVDEVELTGVRRAARREPARIAALDLGSNSFHLLVTELRAGDQFQVIARAKERVFLGESVFRRGSIDDEAFARGLAALRRLREVAADHEPERILVVATSAVREAQNGRLFARGAQQATGLPVRVIDGLEEARLVCLGARRELAQQPGRIALFDFGGGSTEVLVADQRSCALTASLPVGSLRLRQQWTCSDPPTADELAALRASVAAALEPTLAHVERLGFDRVVLACGAARSLLRLGGAVAGNEVAAGAVPHSRELSRETILQLSRRLALVRQADQAEVLGAEAGAANALLIGGVVLGAILERLGAKHAFVATGGLREGLIVDYLAQRASELGALALPR
jgi:exopolyphosphatase/guanosine-5'-triphosphate,3'-diphosphate pyrophosphatase